MASEFRQNLRTATLNGFEFSCMVNTSDDVGRRGVLYEFPFRDEPKWFDLGRKARQHSITAHFFGDDHAARTRSLKAICELPSPHTFSHPYCGTLTVAVRQANIRNGYDQQRETIVDLDLVEFGVGAGGFPINVGNTITGLINIIENARSSAEDDFRENFSLPSSPSPEQDIVVTQLDDVLSNILETSVNNTSINSDTSFDQIFLNAAINSGGQYYLSSSDTANLISSSVENIYNFTEDETQTYEALISLANSLQISVGGFSSQTNENINLIIGNTRIIVAMNAAQAALDNDFSSFLEISQSITEIRNIFAQEIAILAIRCEYELRTELLKIMDSFTELMLERGIGLPGTIITQSCTNLPSLVIAHNIYNDCSRACEIESANKIGNPLFMPETIEALSR